MAVNYSMDFQKFKNDCKELLAKMLAALVAWYNTQSWLKTIVPFLWLEQRKAAEAEVVKLNDLLAKAHASSEEQIMRSVALQNSNDARLAEWEARYAKMEGHLNWLINNGNLNASAKAVGSWLLSELRPDLAQVPRATVETTARKR